MIELRAATMRGTPWRAVGSAPSTDDDPAPFDFAAILGIADAMPVMIAFCDTKLRYRFVNRALADWLEAPRGAILGRTMREVLGDAAFAIARADARCGAGRRAAVVRGRISAIRPAALLAIQTEYIPQFDARRAGQRHHHAGRGHHRATRRRARAQGKRGAVPPHRRFGADADVGHAARPHAATSSTTPMSS